MIKSIPGMDFAQGMELVMQAVAEATMPELVYKHRWAPGDLIVFDNRTCMHTPYPYDFDDYPRTRRLLRQIIVGGREG